MVRLYELAKELGLTSRQLISFYKSKNEKVGSNLSALTDKQAELARTMFAARLAPKPAPPKPKPKPQRLKEGAVIVGKKEIPVTPPPSARPKAISTALPEVEEIDEKVRREREREEERRWRMRRRPRAQPSVSAVRETPELLEKGVHKHPFRRPVPKAVKRPEPVVFKRPQKIDLLTPVTVRDLSTALGVKVKDIITYLMKKNDLLLSINDPIPDDMVVTIGTEYGTEVTLRKPVSAQEKLKEIEKEDKPEECVKRPAVVTILGHVDHGKTSILDYIRKTNVHEREAGGITQHISAYKVKLPNGELTFIDTPGHEAFTAMRARGTNVTDIVVLVVAADDGVMPQTEEAISHARAANVPIVVALNKIDKPNANRLKAKQQLAQLGLNPEEWGGQTVLVEVCALTGEGIPALLDMLLLVADMLDLKANPNRLALGSVLEARVTQGIGVVSTLVVKTGTLHIGDVILGGTCFGRVRALYDMAGNLVSKAEPSTPVQMTGFQEVPEAGEKLYVLRDIDTAREIAIERRERLRAPGPAREHITLETLFEKIEAEKTKELRIILKGDVKGSVEVLTNLLSQLSTEEVKIRIIHSGVGPVSDSDVILADASDAVIIAFNAEMGEKTKELAQEKKVDVRNYQVIYELTSQVRAAMEGLLEPEERESIIGHCEVKQVFRSSRLGTVAGCSVTDGTVQRSASCRVIRENQIVFGGQLDSLRRFKDDVKEVKEGFECGIKIKGFDDVREGDKLEIFIIEKFARTLT
jgi:translation initiation factor IF-2